MGLWINHLGELSKANYIIIKSYNVFFKDSKIVSVTDVLDTNVTSDTLLLLHVLECTKYFLYQKKSM